MGAPSADALQLLLLGQPGGLSPYGAPVNTAPVRVEARGGWTAATSGDTTQTTSPSIDVSPVGGVQVADNDLLLIAVTVDHPSTNISTAAFSVDQATTFGWTRIGPVADTGSPNDHKGVWFWTKWRTGDPTTFTVTCTFAVEWAMSAAAWAGTSDTTPIGTYSYNWETGSTASHATKALTTAVTGSWIGVCNHDRGGSTWTPPTGYTERADVRVTAGTGIAPSVEIADSGGPVTKGLATTLTSTASISSGTAVNLIFEIVPFGQTSNPPPQVVYGPVLGAMTSTGFTAVYGLSGLATTARLQVSTDPSLAVSPIFGSAVADDSYGMVTLSVSGLSADTTYYYGVEADGVLNAVGQGSFRTDPTPGTQASFSVAFGSCQYDAVTSPSFEDIRTRVGTAGQRARRLIHMGDFNYQDWGASDTFDSIVAFWNFQANQTALAPCLANVPLTYCWDNHDWGGSESDKNNVRGTDVANAMRKMVPHYTLPATDGKGAWFSYVIGRVRFIQIDPRSQRDPRSDTPGPSKTMLGAEQKAWFKSELDQTEPVKIIQGNMYWREGAPGTDRWGDYLDEFDELNDYIDANASGNIGHVYVIAGDRHALAADDGTSLTSGQSTRGIPQAVAIFQQGSEDSHETWSHGYYSLEPSTITAYGWLDITDNGTSITIDYQGVTSNDDVTQVSMTTVFSLVQSADAALAVTATLTAAASRSAAAAAALAVTATLAADATAGSPTATAALAATATLTAGATGTHPAGAALAVTATLATAAVPTRVGTAALAVTATLTAAGTATKPAAAALAVTATVSADATTGAAPQLATAALAVTATLSTAATRTAAPTAALAVTATVTAGPARLALPAAALPVVATWTAGTVRSMQSAAALAIVATLTAAATAQGTAVIRPYTGTTARPGPGITVRPYTGVTSRP